jgi:hypothetical protein
MVEASLIGMGDPAPARLERLEIFVCKLARRRRDGLAYIDNKLRRELMATPVVAYPVLKNSVMVEAGQITIDLVAGVLAIVNKSTIQQVSEDPCAIYSPYPSQTGWLI